MSNKVKGLFLTSVLSVAVICVFFGKVIQNPNEIYFASGGDGFKAYYGALYHVQHDTSYMCMNGMNYPFGEMVFFTGSQPLVVNPVKFLSSHFIGMSDNIVGIMNLLMLFSILIAANFTFLVFYEFKVNWVYSAVVALGVCMLSPQVARFGGHFSLSWLFWIPLLLYLIIWFDKKPTFSKAAVIGFATFLAGGMHMYFYGFYGFIIGFYILGQVFNSKRKFRFTRGLLFFIVQFIIPFVLLQVLISANDIVDDRTAFPYGFWAYMGHPFGVFLPTAKPYAIVPKVISAMRHVSWESISFIGVTALVGFCIGVIVFFQKLWRRENPLVVTNSFLLNVLFWSSFAALLFSFGLPFKLGLQGLIDKLGPLRQLRALARFSWLFFYVLNIVVFYNIFQKNRDLARGKKWKIIAFLALGFLMFDACWNLYLNSHLIQNRNPIVTDTLNKLPENEWVKQINSEEFQAILPLPYFHVGSENIWIESKGNTQELTMIASLKTGLPTTGVQLSRTSIGQTYTSYAMVTEPLEKMKMLAELPNQKPLLLLYNRKEYLNEDEERLIKSAELLYQNENIELRKLEISTLAGLHENNLQNIRIEFNDSKHQQFGDYILNDSSLFFIHYSFENIQTEEAYFGDGALQYEGNKWCNVLSDTLKIEKGRKYKLNFWMKDYQIDGSLRAVVEFVQQNAETKEVTNYFYSDAHRHIKGFHENWALIELNFEAKSDNEMVKLAVKNSILKKEILMLDEVIIRENDLNVYYPKNNIQLINGRKLPFTLARL